MLKLEKPTSLQECASRLITLGYRVVPIPGGSKGPSIPGWEKLNLTTDDVAAYWPTTDMLIGVLHTNTAALDIDVYDEELSARIIKEGKRRFPGVLERIGEAPKSALWLRVDGPVWRVQATRKRHKGTLTAQVDIRAHTRQTVVYGRHPDTKQHYRWPGKNLWETPCADLPILNQEDAQSFRDWCEAEIAEWADKDPNNVTDFDRRRFATLDDERPCESMFIEALTFVSPSAGHDDGWCQTLMGIHDYYGGSATGLEVAKDWSSADPRYTPKEVEAKWRSFEAGRGVSYRTVLHLAKEGGANLRELRRKHQPQASTFNATGHTASVDFGADKELRPSFSFDDSDKAATEFDLSGLTADDLSHIAPRRWLYGRKLIRGFCSIIASPGGIGKSALVAAVAADLATGRKYLHDQPHGQLKTWVYNLEDPRDETLRKMAAIRKSRSMSAEELARVIVTSGRDRPLIIAEEREKNVIVAMPDVKAVIDAIKLHKIDVLSVDPFVRAHRLSENDNKHVDFVMDLFAKIAHEANCAVLLVHHTRKGFVSGEADSIRGGSAMSSAARVALTLQGMTAEEAQRMNVPEAERLSLVRIDNAKANLAPRSEKAEWIKLEGIRLENGDDEYPDGDYVQAVTIWEPPNPWDGIGEKTSEILDRIERGYVREDGSVEPYTFKKQSKDRWVVNAVLASFPDGSKSESQAAAIIAYWREKGFITEHDYTGRDRKPAKGVTVSGRPEGVKTDD